MTEDEAIYVDHTAMRAVECSLAARGLAMSLLFEVWFPTKQGFVWDAEDLAARVSAPDATPAMIEAEKDDVAKFFTVLADGRWVPSPAMFSMTDGNPGMVS